MTEVPSTANPRGPLGLLAVSRCAGVRIEPDLGRVIAKPFLPGDVVGSGIHSRIGIALSRILAMAEPDVVTLLAVTRAEFGGRHRGLGAVLQRSVDA